MSKKQRAFADSELQKRLASYKDFKTLTKAEFNKLTEQQKQSYNIKKERYDFCKNKFPHLM